MVSEFDVAFFVKNFMASNFITNFTETLPLFFHRLLPLVTQMFSTLMCLSIGTPKTINFPSVPNGKLILLGVPIFKHFRVTIESFVMRELLLFIP